MPTAQGSTRLAREEDTDRRTVVVDGLIGYGLDQAPRGRAAELIRWASTATTVVSLDVPSGHRHSPHIVPDVTVTLALPKTGLSQHAAGRSFLADIGIPPILYQRHLGIDAAPIFLSGDIMQLT
jgi:NAD(P)H-hydrate epimerase